MSFGGHSEPPSSVFLVERLHTATNAVGLGSDTVDSSRSHGPQEPARRVPFCARSVLDGAASKR